MPKNINHICRVCAHDDDEFPWGEDGKMASFNICVCCGVTWGHEDSLPSGVRKYREKWLASGAKWFARRRKKPENWNLEEQLKNIPEKFR